MQKVVGIDLGTTSISGVVLDVDTGNLLEKRTISGGHFLENGRSWERVQDAEEIIQKAKELIDEFLELHEDISAIGVDCQMHGIVYLDEEGGLRSPLFTWQDGRGDLKGKDGKTVLEEIEAVTGEHAATGYGMVTHIYNWKNGLVPEKAAVICTIGDYLVLKLTGRKSPLMHSSNAASLGLFDSEHGYFYKKKLEQMGIDCKILPEVSGEIRNLGTYKGRAVYAAIGDNQASFLGAVGLKKEKVLVNIGTGSQISMLTEKYMKIPGMDTRPVLKNQWLLVGVSLCGGKAYAMLEKFFRSYVQAQCEVTAGEEEQKSVESQYSVMEVLARQALMVRQKSEKSEKMKISPLFCGTREDASVRGSITGISDVNFTPGEMILSMMEGMIQDLYETYMNMEKYAGIKAAEVVMSGNGVRKNEILKQIIAERFALPFSVSENAEEAACGAALSTTTL